MIYLSFNKHYYNTYTSFINEVKDRNYNFSVFYIADIIHVSLYFEASYEFFYSYIF